MNTHTVTPRVYADLHLYPRGCVFSALTAPCVRVYVCVCVCVCVCERERERERERATSTHFHSVTGLVRTRSRSLAPCVLRGAYVCITPKHTHAQSPLTLCST